MTTLPDTRWDEGTRAVIARIGGNEYRRRAWSEGRWYPRSQDPHNIASWAMLATAADRFTPGFGRQFAPVAAETESELRALDGDR